jgi:transposase InsO family protein
VPARRYARIVTPEELANFAHLRRARDLIDREYARRWSFSARFTQLVGETPTAYRARDHGALASVPGCVAKDITRPSPRTEQDRRNAHGVGPLALRA